jgi:hypothetical protein
MTFDPKNLRNPVMRFFFLPSDPICLGLMRILIGLVALYTHAAYSVELLDTVGPKAWWDHQAANAQRRTAPYWVAPNDWRVPQIPIYLEGEPERRVAIMQFLRNLPEDPAERRKAFALLKRLTELGTQFNLSLKDHEDQVRNFISGPVQTASLMVARAKLGDEKEKERLERAKEYLAFDSKQLQLYSAPPPLTWDDRRGVTLFISFLPPEERLKVWQEILDFSAVLPDALSPSDDPKSFGLRNSYVIAWLGLSMPGDNRRGAYQFLVGERVDHEGRNISLPNDLAERESWLMNYHVWGTDYRQAYHIGIPNFSIYFHLEDANSIRLAHALVLLVLVLFTLGVWTRVTSVLAFLGTLFYIHRGQWYLFGQDTMQTIALFYLAIGPSGAALSIDRLYARFRAARALHRAGDQKVPWAEAILAGPPKTWLANLTLRLLQIHYCLMYLSAGMAKLKGNAWWNHEAGWMSIASPEFGMVHFKAYESILHFLADHRMLGSAVAGGISIFTLALELGFIFLAWTKLRWLVVTGSILLHLGIGPFMGLHVFGMHMFCLLLCFFPAALVRSRVSWPVGSGEKFKLTFNPNSPSSLRIANLVRMFDIAQQVTFEKGTRTAYSLNQAVQIEGPSAFKTALDKLVLTSALPGLSRFVHLVFSPFIKAKE